jgi:hypothetical protein
MLTRNAHLVYKIYELHPVHAVGLTVEIAIVELEDKKG